MPLYILYGVGRTQWEATNKAIFADFFPGGTDRAAAFASLNFVRSVSAALLSIVVSIDADVVGLAITLLFPVALSIPGYYASKHGWFGSRGLASFLDQSASGAAQ